MLRTPATLGRMALVVLAVALPTVWLSGVGAAAQDQSQQLDQAEQTLVWTADNSYTEYKSAPATATAGLTTIVFETSASTGNTSGMTHTLTFDVSTPGYNHDVNVNILASPFDANGGRHEVQVNLTPGTYRYFCAIPGHGSMAGEFVVTSAGPTDTTPPQVSASVSGEQDAEGDYVDSATVTVSATDTESGVDTVEYALDGGAFQAYTAPVPVNQVGEHTVSYRATDKAGNTSDVATADFTVVAAPPPARTPLTVTASSRCVGTSAYVAVTAVNDGDVPATVTLTTPYGSRTVTDVAPGKQAYQSFNARAGQIGAGTVTVTGTSSIDGENVTTSYEAGHTAISCG